MRSNRLINPIWLRYAVAVAVVAAAAGLRVVLLRELGTRAPYVTFYPAIVLVALFGGLWCGVAATVLSALLVLYFWLAPVGQFSVQDPADWIGLGVFLVSCTMICAVTEAMHRARSRAAEAEAEAKLSRERQRSEAALRIANEELERRVAERTAELAEKSQGLKENEARYRSLVTASAQIVWLTDAEGRIAVELPAWQAFTGQTPEQYLGSGWAEAVHPEDRERTQAVWERAVATRGLYETEYRLRRHDGKYRYVSARGVPVLDEEHRIREWVGTCTDITVHQEADRRREFTNALLGLFAHKASAKEYLDAVVEVIRQWCGCEALGIRIKDERQEIPYESWTGFNPAFIELENRLSLERDTCCCIRAISQTYEEQDRPLLTPGGSYCCADSIGFLERLPQEKQAHYRGNCMKFGYASLAVIPIRGRGQVLGAVHLADPRPGRFPPAAIEFIESMAPLIGEAVRRFQAETELAKYRDQLEELVKQRTNELVIANARLQIEIAERRRAQETLQQTAQDLERSNRDLEQFAYVASHDLQEPLRAVGGYVKLLQRRFPDELDAKGLEYIAGAADGAARMERLITDLLAFSRVGTQGGAPAMADLNALLGHALNNLQASIQYAQATVTREPMPSLAVDATQMVQLFQNLIGNALKFRSERPPQIHVGAQPQPDRWVFSVRDNGIGIEPQYFQRIFQIFQRLHTRKHYPGTGIGLAICKKIVERHGGTIWVESQPERGSTFYFSIPEISAIKEAAV